MGLSRFMSKAILSGAINELRTYRSTNGLFPYFDIDVFSALQIVRKPEALPASVEFALACVFALGFALSLAGC